MLEVCRGLRIGGGTSYKLFSAHSPLEGAVVVVLLVVILSTLLSTHSTSAVSKSGDTTAFVIIFAKQCLISKACFLS